jgi:Ca2+-binding EF-hand superfamily protein
MGNKTEKLKNKKQEQLKEKSSTIKDFNHYSNVKEKSIVIEKVYDPFLFRNLDQKPVLTATDITKLTEQLKPDELSKNELENFVLETGLTKEQIEEIYEKFKKKAKGNELDKRQFIQLYSDLRSEPNDKLMPISNFIFELFDKDKSGTLNIF